MPLRARIIYAKNIVTHLTRYAPLLEIHSRPEFPSSSGTHFAPTPNSNFPRRLSRSLSLSSTSGNVSFLRYKRLLLKIAFESSAVRSIRRGEENEARISLSAHHGAIHVECFVGSRIYRRIYCSNGKEKGLGPGIDTFRRPPTRARLALSICYILIILRCTIALRARA